FGAWTRSIGTGGTGRTDVQQLREMGGALGFGHGASEADVRGALGALSSTNLTGDAAKGLDRARALHAKMIDESREYAEASPAAQVEMLTKRLKADGGSWGT